jgi:WhiB family redox-sensing transcriptional regulator
MYSDNSFIEFAKCKSTKQVDFHSEDYQEVKRAIAFCRDCPVKTACLNYALENNIKYGVWGGTSAYARRKMKLNHLSNSVS